MRLRGSWQSAGHRPFRRSGCSPRTIARARPFRGRPSADRGRVSVSALVGAQRRARRRILRARGADQGRRQREHGRHPGPFDALPMSGELSITSRCHEGTARVFSHSTAVGGTRASLLQFSAPRTEIYTALNRPRCPDVRLLHHATSLDTTCGEPHSMTERGEDLHRWLAPFGAPTDGVVLLDEPAGPSHLPHLDMRARSGAPPLVDAVVEIQRRAVLYITRGPKSSEELCALRHTLIQRGSADHLGIIRPGSLTIYPLLPPREDDGCKTLRAEDIGSAAAIPSLAFSLRADGHQGTAHRLHTVLVDLLSSAINEIADTGVSRDDALSLVGRALFMRFLLDRGVIGESEISTVCPTATAASECMASSVSIRHTNRWLDHTFNGNLLPLTRRGNSVFWGGIEPREQATICGELSKIMYKADRSGQLSFGWSTLDFGHIPVGLLSQVYEIHSHRTSPVSARNESIHYTPRAIAEYMVDEALYDLDHSHRVRVLDPAAGAGVFLVAAFRALVASWWRRYSKRPRTKTIRRILYNQLTGFDINESALRLSALSLYLTALELDPSPQPLSHLRFENLRGRVLFDVRTREDRKRERQCLPVLGSLAPNLVRKHREMYDLVIGNPPWSNWQRPAPLPDSNTRPPALNAIFDQCLDTVETSIQAIVERRLGQAFSQSASKRTKNKWMVDNTPDIPFCWQATEWAKPNGRIAFALHGRLLFKRSDAGERARVALFRGIRVLGVLNGSALRETNVWPGVKAQFCLLFAENRASTTEDLFTYVSPVIDDELNRCGHIRIDPSSATSLSSESVEKEPWLFKTLFRGTLLDAGVIRVLGAPENPSLETYLQKFNIEPRTGYTMGSPSTRNSDATDLLGLPDLNDREQYRFYRQSVGHLEPFKHKVLKRAPVRDIFRAPLLILRESPGERLRETATLASSDVVFCESFYGISCKSHPQSDLLARYLLLVLNSDLFPYFALMQCGKYGVERYAVELQDLKRFPIRPLEALNPATVARITLLSDRVLKGQATNWDEIHSLLAGVYGLSPWDLETMSDALEVSLQYRTSLDRAQISPDISEREKFVQRLKAQLDPLLQRVSRSVSVRTLDVCPDYPWHFIEILSRAISDASPEMSRLPDFAAFIDEAERHGATRVTHVTGGGTLLVGVLAQYRYWTPSRARLLALDLLNEHGALLQGTDIV